MQIHFFSEESNKYHFSSHTLEAHEIPVNAALVLAGVVKFVKVRDLYIRHTRDV